MLGIRLIPVSLCFACLGLASVVAAGTGACCINECGIPVACMDGYEEQTCLDLGGDWFGGFDCEDIFSEPVQWTVEQGGNGHWYKFVYFGDLTDWNATDTWCLNIGGHLCTLGSAEENAFVSALPVESNTMLGGYRSGSQWMWVTGEPWNYSNWNCHDCHTSCQPDNSSNAENKLFFMCEMETGERKWNDFVGDVNWGGGGGRSCVIEYEADCNGDGIVDYGQILDGSLADIDCNGIPDTCLPVEGIGACCISECAVAQCMDGYDEQACLDLGGDWFGGSACQDIPCGPVQWTVGEGGNGHWYVSYPHHAPGMTWNEAADQATALGGSLACCESESENAWLLASIGGEGIGFYIGLYQDLDAEDYSEPAGGWRWLSGEQVDFTNWNPPNEPNNSSGGTEHWAHFLSNGCWNDYPDQPDGDAILVIEYEADCNGDGIVDYGQILDGSLADIDCNGIPDICGETGACCISECAVAQCMDGYEEQSCLDLGGEWFEGSACQDISCGPVQWTEAEGGNGHWYDFAPAFISWSNARLAAESVGGYLCCMETAEEWVWIRTEMVEPSADELFSESGWGVCIGGFQDLDSPDYSEPYGGWEWLTGVPFQCGGEFDCNMENYFGAQHNMALLQNSGSPIQFNDIDEVPDQPYYMIEWSADCNNDGIVDYGQILEGTLIDLDCDGIPDICEDPGACCLAGQCEELPSGDNCIALGGIWHLGYACTDTEASCLQGTYTVCTSGCDFSDIQSAIDYSSPGDVIEIGEGVYTGTGDAVIVLPAHGITLRGSTFDPDGNPTTIIDGENARRGIVIQGPSIPVEAMQWSSAMGGNDHWYMGYGAAEVDYETWADASAIAQSLGGHLATCTTSEENDFVEIVRDTTSTWGGAWIGLLQSPEGQEPDGGWGWVTGEPLEWTNWSVNPPQPDNSDNDGNESDYAEMCCDADIWGDWSGDKTLPYLVEWEQTIIEGLLIRDCHAAGSGGDGIGDGGGMLIDAASPRVLNCTFEQNIADDEGGGVYAMDGNPTFVDCTFTSNQSLAKGGGISFVRCEMASMKGCDFLGNQSSDKAGALMLHESDVSLDNCYLQANFSTGNGGGIYCHQSSPVVTGSTISMNMASSGGGIYTGDTSNPNLADTLVCGNVTDQIAGEGEWTDNGGNIISTTCGGDGTSTWTGGGATNEFHDPENWMFGDIPAAGSEVIFGLDDTFQVDFTEGEVSLTLDVTAGDVTFDLAGNDYTIEDDDPDDAVHSYIRVEQVPDGEAFNASLTLVNSSESGAELSCDYDVDIANSIGSIGSINLIGDVSLSIQETMRVASYGDGFFLMQDGAQADMISLDVGLFSGSFGEIQLIGDSTRLAIESQLEIKNGRVELIDMPVLAVVDSGVALRRDGWLGGYGVIEGDVYNYGGTFELDSDPGGVLRGPVQGFQVTGKYKQKEGGKLLMKASNDATSFLEIGWLAELGGGLIVSQQEGTQPPSGEVYAILSAPEIDGQFDVALMPDLSDSDLYMSLQYASQLGLRGADVVEIVIEDLVDDVGFNDLPAPVLDGVPAALAVADFGGNGTVDDLAIALSGTEGNGSIHVFLNDNNGGWGPGQVIWMTGTFDPGELTAIDIDGDGDTDLVGTNNAEDTFFIIDNDNGVFLSPESRSTTGAGPTGLAVVDIDGLPGVERLYIACTDSGTVERWDAGGVRGGRDFPFMYFYAWDNLDNPFDIDPIDDNEDKDVALIVTLGGSDQVGIIRDPVGMRGSIEKYSVGVAPTNVAAGRLDGSEIGGWDAVTTNEGDGTISILVSDPDDVFKPAVNLPVGGTPRSIALVDLDADDDLDITVIIVDEAGGAAVVVLRNDTSSGSDTLLFAPAEVLTITGIPLMVDQGLINADSQPDLVTINHPASGRAGDDEPYDPVSLVGNAFEPATGACCIDDEPCKITTNTECDVSGGSEWLIGADCDACVGPTGPCCFAESCDQEAYEDDCDAGGGKWLGAEATCEDCPAPECSGDVDSNGAVDVVDLLAVINYWGQCEGGLCETADINDDGQVDVVDLLAVIAGWGPCLP